MLHKYVKILAWILVSCLVLSIIVLTILYFRPEKRKNRHFQKGLIYFREKRYLNATWEFKDALAIAPEDIQIRFQLAKAYASGEEYEKAIAETERIIREQPTYHAAYLFLANLQLQQKKYQQALAACDQLLKIKPDDFEAMNERGIILWRMGYKKQAEYEFQKVIQKNPKEVKGHLNLARLYWDMNQYPESIAVLKKYLIEDPKNFEIRLELGNYYTGKKDYAAALPEFEQLLKDFPDKFSQIAPGYSLTLLNMGQLQKAMQIADQALGNQPEDTEYVPKDPILAYVRGIGRLETKDYSGAINDLLWVQRNHGDLADVHFNLGKAYMAMKKNLLAIQSLEHAARLHAESPIIRQHLIEALILEKRWDRGLEHCNAYLEIDPQNDAIRNLKAQILIQLGQATEARQLLQKLQETSPNSPQSQVGIALLEASQKKYDTAIAILKKLDQQFPKNYYISYLLAQMYFAKQDIINALLWVFQSIEQNPDFIASTILLADIRVFQGNLELAVAEYQKLWERDKTDDKTLVELIQYKLKARQFDECLKLLEENGYDQSKDPDFLLCLADIGFAKQDYEEALRYLKQIPPKEVRIYFLMGDCNFYQGKYYEALSHYEMAKMFDNDPNATLRIAITLYLQREWQLCIATLEQYTDKVKGDLPYLLMAANYLIDGQPKLALERIAKATSPSYQWLAKLMLVGVYVYQDNFKAAKQELQKLKTMRPSLAMNFESLLDFCEQNRANFIPLLGALVLQEMGYPYAAMLKCKESLQILANHPVVEYIYANILQQLHKDEAWEIMTRLAQTPGTPVDVLCDLGIHSYQQQNIAQAQMYLKQALTIDPKLPEALMTLGMIAADQKNIPLALEYHLKCLAVIEKDPDHSLWAQVANNLAWLYLQGSTPQPKLALDWAKKAFAKVSWDGGVLDTLGWAYFHNQDYPKALEYLQHANRLMPDQPTIHYHLAEVYVQLKLLPSAQTMLEKALALSSTFPEVTQAKELLKKIKQ